MRGTAGAAAAVGTITVTAPVSEASGSLVATNSPAPLVLAALEENSSVTVAMDAIDAKVICIPFWLCGCSSQTIPFWP
jgi:hypothetical protein